MAKTVEELPVYAKILEFSPAVTALLKTPKLSKNFKLRNQIADATSAIEANLEEGFEQGTDRAFRTISQYLKRLSR